VVQFNFVFLFLLFFLLGAASASPLLDFLYVGVNPCVVLGQGVLVGLGGQYALRRRDNKRVLEEGMISEMIILFLSAFFRNTCVSLLLVV